MFKSSFVLIAALFCSVLFGAETPPLEAMFAERAKCAVAVKFSIELEEDRNQILTMGMVADANGLVVVPPNEIPLRLRHDELKDFKIFFFGGDVDGYPAEYLGADGVTGVHFIKIKKGLPKELVPFTKFSRAKAFLGQNVWGVGIYPESFMFEPYYMKSYITDIGKRPLMKAATEQSVAAVGTAVFDESGNFVGWGQSQTIESKILYAQKINGLMINLVSPITTDGFIFPDELDEILEHIPSKPEGDSHGWLGLVNTKVLKRDVAKMMGIVDKSAFLVSDVAADSPAGKAGLKKGDIIVGIDGKDLELIGFDEFALYNFMRKYARKNVGDTVSLSIIRGSDAPKTFELKLEKNPKTFRQSRTEYFKRIGFSAREYLFDDGVARKNLNAKIDAPVVKYVKPNSPAASALPNRLIAGDLIKEINSVPVKSYSEAVAELSKINGDEKVKELVILAEDLKETKVIRIKLD